MNETYNAPSFGYGHSVIRASDKMKSLLEIYTANVNRGLQGIAWNLESNSVVVVVN